MALSGGHIEFCIGSDGDNTRSGNPVLRGSASSSQTMASAGTNSASAPGAAGSSLQPILTISASAPIYFAVGASPDATNGPRSYLDPANGGLDLFVKAGDKVAWAFA